MMWHLVWLEVTYGIGCTSIMTVKSYKSKTSAKIAYSKTKVRYVEVNSSPQKGDIMERRLTILSDSEIDIKDRQYGKT